MVLNEDKALEAEAIIKELSLFSFSKEDLASGKIEDISRFEVLMSRYASLKNNPELKALVSQLEDKYQIPKTVSANVETYNQLRKELLSAKELEEFNDREQMLLRTNETVDISQLSTAEQIDRLAKQWQAVEKAARNYNQAKKELQKADKKLADNYHKKPSDRRGIIFAVCITRGKEGTQKFIKENLPSELQSNAQKHLKEIENLIQQNGGVPPRLTREETGRLLFPSDEQHHQNMGKDVHVSVSAEGAENLLASVRCYANNDRASAIFCNTFGVLNKNYGNANTEAQQQIGSLNVPSDVVVAMKIAFPDLMKQGNTSLTVGPWLNQINQELMKVPQGNVTNRLQQASDGKEQRFSGVSARLDGLQEGRLDQNKGVSTVKETFKLR